MSEIQIEQVREWARAGGDIALRYFNKVDARRKPDRSWVTQADIEIEHFLREKIQAHYPHHGIMGEEHPPYKIDREFVWSIDPLDGTDAFIQGLPVWGVSIGILRAGRPYMGVVYVPIMQDCYWTDEQGGAYLNDLPIYVNPTTSIERGDWMLVTSRAHRDYSISFPGKTRSLGSLAVHICYVARGSALGALLGHPHLWDIAAGLAILRAAGGTACFLDRRPFDPRPLLDGSASRQPVLIATPALNDTLLQMIQRRSPEEK